MEVPSGLDVKQPKWDVEATGVETEANRRKVQIPGVGCGLAFGRIAGNLFEQFKRVPVGFNYPNIPTIPGSKT